VCGCRWWCWWSLWQAAWPTSTARCGGALHSTALHCTAILQTKPNCTARAVLYCTARGARVHCSLWHLSRCLTSNTLGTQCFCICEAFVYTTCTLPCICTSSVKLAPTTCGSHYKLHAQHWQATFTIRGATSAAKVLQPHTAPTQQLSGSYRPTQRLFFRAGDTAIRWVPHATVHGT
jgi:hypothetical protein